MASRNLLTWLFIFLLTISTAVAIEDFTATGTGRILGFACSPAQGEITVTNTGDLVSIYELVPEGNARNWVSFVPQSFTLNPGQTATIQEFFDIPCDAQDEWLDVAILTPDLELLLSQEILVQTPNNLVLEPVVFSQEVLACEAADFSFKLSNPAEFTETYSLKVLDSPVEAILNHEEITLAPETEETITVTIRPKDCTLSGDYMPVLVVETEKSRIAAELDLSLRIQDFDIPNLAEGIESIRAGYSAQEASFEIENTGDRSTDYLLSIDGPSWVSVVPSFITVDAHDSEEVKLVLQPTEDAPRGKHEVTLTAEVAATKTEYTKEFTIKLGPATLFETLFENNLPLTIAGIVLIIILVFIIVYSVKKYNSPEAKEKRAERKAEKERLNKERQKLKEQKKLEKQRAKEKKIEAKRKEKEQRAKDIERQEHQIERERYKAQKAYDKQLRKEHLVLPKESIIAGIKQPSKILWKLALIFLILIIAAFALTFSSAIADNLQSVLTALVVLIVFLFLQKMRRQRRARGKWKLARADKQLDLNTKWKKGLTQVSFKLESFVNKLIVKVKRAKPTVPSPFKNTFQTFVITPNVEAEEIAEARITFSVKRSWLMRKRVSPSDVKLIHLQDNEWQNVSTKVASTSDKYVTFVANAVGFGEFAIVGKAGRQVAKPKRKLGRIFGWTLFTIVAIIALFSFAYMPSTADSIGIPNQVWKQDTQHRVDLSEYFQDPDGDALSFSASSTENVDITIVGSQALLTPQHGWIGVESTVFNADDGKGGLVMSNPVSLIVESKFKSEFKQSAKPIFTTSIVVLLLILAVMFRKRLKKTIGLE